MLLNLICTKGLSMCFVWGRKCYAWNFLGERKGMLSLSYEKWRWMSRDSDGFWNYDRKWISPKIRNIWCFNLERELFSQKRIIWNISCIFAHIRVFLVRFIAVSTLVALVCFGSCLCYSFSFCFLFLSLSLSLSVKFKIISTLSFPIFLRNCLTLSHPVSPHKFASSRHLLTWLFKILQKHEITAWNLLSSQLNQYFKPICMSCIVNH